MREGVNKVTLRLFEHNEKAYHAAVRMMEQYGKAAIVHPTGTGKSYIAFKLIEDNPEKVVIWLSPSEYIFKTQLESLKKNDPGFPLSNVHFYTYAKLMCCTQAQLEKIAAQKPAYIILDEFHRAGAECWGESTVALLKLCPEAKLLGLTATNIRYLDNNRDMAEELFDGHTASDMTLGEAVVRGILPAPKYVTTVYQYQKTLAKYQARVDNLRAPGIQDVNQKYLDALRRALEQADGLDLVFQHHITQTSGKYIVFCANKEHMDEMVSHVPEWFAGVNPDVVVYEAYSDDPNTDKAFADFKTDTSDRLKLLFCILAFCKPHGQFIAHLISFLCGNLTGLEGLSNLISNHIIFLSAPSHQFILAFGEHKFFVCGQGAALIAADQLSLVRFVRILRIVRAAFQAGRNGFPLVFVQCNQSCCSQLDHLPAKRKCRTVAA